MGTEWVIIAVVGVGLIFGAKKIPELARSFGRVEGEYKKAKEQAKSELELLKLNPRQGDRARLEDVADKLGIDHANKNDVELKAAIEAELQKTTRSR